MPSFDAVCKLDKAEVDNAFQHASKAVGQRYDFKGTGTELERTDEGILIRSSNAEHVEAAWGVLLEKMIKRGVSGRALERGKIEPAARSTFRQLIELKEGISVEKGKELVKAIKEAKLKVQAQIMDDQVRVSGKNRDDLQAAIRLLRSTDFGVDLQFINMRE